jgi:carboxy-cis,cis-muconate cyclase
MIHIGANVTQFWSAEAMISASNKYLWASTRAQVNTNRTGYISCFELDRNGHIRKQLFMVPTTTIGDIANQVSPDPFSDTAMGGWSTKIGPWKC